MTRKMYKVYLSKAQQGFLETVTTRLGMKYSAFFEMLLMNYLKEVNLIKEAVHRG